MGSLEIHDSFQPYSADRDDDRPTLTYVKPDSVKAAKAAIEHIRQRHGRTKTAQLRIERQKR